MRTGKRLVIGLATAAVALTLSSNAAMAAPTSTAYPGGCSTPSQGEKACISIANGTVITDGYVSGLPSTCFQVYVSLVNNSGGIVGFSTASSCSSGHKPGQSNSASSLGHGFFKARITYKLTNGNYVGPVDSPVLQI